LISGRDNKDRTSQSLWPEITFDKLTNLSTSLSDERDHVDIAMRVLGHHSEEGRFTNSRTGHDTDTLPLTNGEKTIHRANPQIETVVDTGSRNRIGWISKEGHALIHDRKGLAV
jgi:hypothetical protein